MTNLTPIQTIVLETFRGPLTRSGSQVTNDIARRHGQRSKPPRCFRQTTEEVCGQLRKLGLLRVDADDRYHPTQQGEILLDLITNPARRA